jgi:phage repressor protein C with HTH and peptisase S24 domain
MVGITFADRLEWVIEKFESPHAFSKKAGISDTMIRKYLAGSSPGVDALVKISDAADVNLDWLAAGRGPKYRSENAAPGAGADVSLVINDSRPGEVMFFQAKAASSDFALIPRLDVQASAGGGRLASSEDPLEYLAFQSDWLRSRGINPNTARILTARGDSMEETIRDGDVLLVDTSINRVKDNAIYVVVYGDMVLVKRIHGRLNGSFQLISDNPRYPAEEVTPGEVDLLNIAGRVMWFGRSI